MAGIMQPQSENNKDLVPMGESNAVEDMIQDLYSEDSLDQDDYESPEVRKESALPKLAQVIEESQDYSVTPSRIA